MNLNSFLKTATIILFFLAPRALLAGGAKTVWVNSYTRSDGTYVSGYWRSPPDGTGSGVSVSSASGYTTPSTASSSHHHYYYHVHVYEKGAEICVAGTGGAGGRSHEEVEDTYDQAMEKTLWDLSACLHQVLYMRGLNHDQVAEFLSRTFTQDSCRVESSGDQAWGAAGTLNETTMSCIVPPSPATPTTTTPVKSGR